MKKLEHLYLMTTYDVIGTSDTFNNGLSTDTQAKLVF